MGMNWTAVRHCEACGAGCPADAIQCLRCGNKNIGPARKTLPPPRRDNLSRRILNHEVRSTEIVEGFTILDGGTTGVTLLHNGNEDAYVFYYSLPNDGRLRCIMHVGIQERRLQPDGLEEQRLHQELRQSLDEEFGRQAVEEFLCGQLPFPDEEPWYSAVHFLHLMRKERKWCQPTSLGDSSPHADRGTPEVTAGNQK